MNTISDDAAVNNHMDYDSQTVAVMKRILEANSNCIDVGCHAGNFMDVILKLAPNGTHLGFGPIPDLHRNLRDKYAYNVNVTIHNYALADIRGETSFQHVTTNQAYSTRCY
jgi:FkbM family methyltransferase